MKRWIEAQRTLGITCLYDIEEAFQSKGVCHANYIDNGQGARAPKYCPEIMYSKQNTDLLAIANGPVIISQHLLDFEYPFILWRPFCVSIIEAPSPLTSLLSFPVSIYTARGISQPSSFFLRLTEVWFPILYSRLLLYSSSVSHIRLGILLSVRHQLSISPLIMPLLRFLPIFLFYHTSTFDPCYPCTSFPKVVDASSYADPLVAASSRYHPLSSQFIRR